MLGKYAAMYLIEGGPGFPFLHQYVFLSLFTDIGQSGLLR